VNLEFPTEPSRELLGAAGLQDKPAVDDDSLWLGYESAHPWTCALADMGTHGSAPERRN